MYGAFNYSTCLSSRQKLRVLYLIILHCMKIKRHGFTVAFAALVLLATLAFSQQVHATATNTASSTFIFSHNHQLHDTGPDILALQKFLNTHDFAVAQTGPGSPGKETRFFGLATFRALKNYQTAQGLPATGFFGPLTRTALTTFAAGPSSVSDSSSNTTPSTPSNTFRTILPSWFPKAISGGYTPGFGGGGGGGGGSSAPPADTTPPARSAGAPSGTLTLGTTSTTLSLTTDEAATCKYAATAGTAFGSMAAFSTSGGTSNSTSVSGLSNGGSYIYYDFIHCCGRYHFADGIRYRSEQQCDRYRKFRNNIRKCD